MKKIKEIKEIDRFFTKTDDGEEYEIIQYQEFIDASSHDDPNAEVPGIKRFRTSNGLFVQYIDPNTFKIITSSKIIKRVL
jgi:hypothetical protein